MARSGGVPSRRREVDAVVAGVRAWALEQSDVLAVGLAGSVARGTAGPSSDVDLVLPTRDPADYDSADRTCGFAPENWAAVPVDAGTARVVADGFVVLHDPAGLLGRLVREVARRS